MQSPKIFADKIFYYEGIIHNPEQVVTTIESTDRILSDNSLISSWHDWSANDDNSHFFGKRKFTNPSEFFSSDDETKEVYLILDSVLSAYGKDYAEKLSVDLGRRAPISISKYTTGASMGVHTDSGPNPVNENISAVLYLNDDYEGGELNFPDQGVRIKPSAGSLVIFPSIPPFYHESLEILSGTKYMSPAFWHLSN
jgi:hypothetical protein